MVPSVLLRPVVAEAVTAGDAVLLRFPNGAVVVDQWPADALAAAGYVAPDGALVSVGEAGAGFRFVPLLPPVVRSVDGRLWTIDGLSAKGVSPREAAAAPLAVRVEDADVVGGKDRWFFRADVNLPPGAVVLVRVPERALRSRWAVGVVAPDHHERTTGELVITAERRAVMASPLRA